MISEEIIFYGHQNVLSLHPRTLEITKDKDLTPSGDCIIGVNANKSCKDLCYILKENIKKNDSMVKIELIVEPYAFVIEGHGNQYLSLTHPHDIVLRKSKFICNRTISIDCNFSALEIPRKMIDLLKDNRKVGRMIINVEK